MRFRYQSRVCGREGKSRLLDELVKVCCVVRKHAINSIIRLAKTLASWDEAIACM